MVFPWLFGAENGFWETLSHRSRKWAARPADSETDVLGRGIARAESGAQETNRPGSAPQQCIPEQASHPL